MSLAYICHNDSEFLSMDGRFFDTLRKICGYLLMGSGNLAQQGHTENRMSWLHEQPLLLPDNRKTVDVG
jgi:hypothetical protein